MRIPGTIRVMVVDDHPLLREGIAAVLEGEEEISLVAEAANGREAIEKFRTLFPDVTLMDLQLPDISDPTSAALRPLSRYASNSLQLVLSC